MYEGIAQHILPWLEGKWAPPFRIHIFPTDRCNLRCRSCWRWKVTKDGRISWVQNELSDQKLLLLIEEGAELGVKEWELSGGGEPLVRNEITLKMMEKIKKLGMRGDITTNATLFTPEIIKYLIEIKWDHMIVSLDGPNSEINDYLRPPSGTFEKIIRTLESLRIQKKRLNRENPVLAIQCVLSKVNIDHIIPMVKLAIHYGIKDLVFEPIKYFSERCKDLLLQNEDYTKLERYIREAAHIATENGLFTNLESFLTQPELVTKVGEMDHFLQNKYKTNGQLVTNPFLNVPCYEPWYRMLISPIGDTAPCCLAEYSQQDNMKTKSLLEIWLGDNFQNFREKIFTKNLPPSCKQCHAGLINHSNYIRSELLKILESQTQDTEFTPIEKIQVRGSCRKELNICIVSREYPSETDWGGIGKYTYLTATGLAKMGYRVHVISQTLKEEEYEQQLEGVWVHRIKHPNIFNFRYPFEEFARRIEYSWRVYKKILELIDKYGIQIVEGPNFSAECLIYSLLKKTPLVTRIHTPYEEVVKNFGWKMTLDRKLSCMLEDELIKRSDRVICSTHIYAEKISREHTIGEVKVIPLGIVMPQGNNALFKMREQNRKLNILFVGRLEKRKGIHVLMQAIPEVLQEIPDAEFTIIGRDSFFKDDEISFESSKGKNFKTEFWDTLPDYVKGKVHLLGRVEDGELEKYYKNCDLFVAPSLHETFGYVYLEAMSYGKPVIGCSVGGVPEVIKDGETGILVEPSDSEKLAQAMINVLKFRSTRIKMGIQARNYVARNFSLQRLVERTERLYKNVLSSTSVQSCKAENKRTRKVLVTDIIG